MTNDMPERPSAAPVPTRRIRLAIPSAIGAVLVGAAVGFAGIYGVSGLKRTPVGDPACRAAVDIAQRIAPLAHGEVAALTMATTPLQLPDLAFEDADGKPKKLSDWRGKTVLVITHDDKYFHLADRFIKLDYGKIEHGNTEQWKVIAGRLRSLTAVETVQLLDDPK